MEIYNIDSIYTYVQSLKEQRRGLLSYNLKYIRKEAVHT
jgi:hypothetical protein